MKYAFLFGSNAYIVDQPVITYVQDGNTIEVLRIKSLYAHTANDTANHALLVDTNLTDVNHHNIVLADNDYNHPDYIVHRTDKHIHVTNKAGLIIIDVLQLDEDALSGLSSHVINELNNTGVENVIRFRGDFMIGEHHITIDNEKFYVDNDVFAESVHVVHGGVELSKYGVKI